MVFFTILVLASALVINVKLMEGLLYNVSGSHLSY